MQVLRGCRGVHLGSWVTLLLIASFCYCDDTSVEVVGIGECKDCATSNIKTSHAFSGLQVAIVCKVGEGELTTRGVGELDQEGKFTVKLPSEILKEGGELKEECFAQLHSASSTPCPTHNGLKASKIIFKSKHKGKHTFGPAGKLAFSPITCTSAFLRPHFKYPPLPKLFITPTSTNPLLPTAYNPACNCNTPPTVSPPVYNNPLPPPVPIYNPPPKVSPPVYNNPLPPPVPIYNPPPKGRLKNPVPPPVPIFIPPPTVNPPVCPPIPKAPVYKKPLPPPVPIYKKPLPPPVPIYKKPLPPPVPVYKKPLPPPVPIYKKPLPPPVPVYKKPLPPPVPIYKKPHPPPVPVYKKPCPPPVPIYKKPLPPPVPVYKKPLPPPVPIYKKPHPPPVPVYKKPCPPPVPIYKKPLPPPVPIYKKPCPPPIPKIPPVYKKPCPPTPQLPPVPPF